MCNLLSFFSFCKPALLFTDLPNTENANVAHNAAQGGEDLAGHHDGRLFNEDPHGMNDIFIYLAISPTSTMWVKMFLLFQ
jgi:hypothetical protein